MTIRQWRVSRDTLIRDANDVYYLSLASQFAVGYRKVNDAMLLQYEWMWAVTFYHVIVSHQTFPVQRIWQRSSNPKFQVHVIYTTSTVLVKDY